MSMPSWLREKFEPTATVKVKDTPSIADTINESEPADKKVETVVEENKVEPVCIIAPTAFPAEKEDKHPSSKDSKSKKSAKKNR